MDAKEAVRFYLDCEKHDPNGVLPRFLPMYSIADILRKRGLPEEQCREEINAAYVDVLIAWGKEYPDHVFAWEDSFWLITIASDLGIGETMSTGILKYALEHDPQHVYRNLQKMREEGMIPASLTDPEYLALAFDPPEMKLTPGHPIWQSLGVSNSKEWRELGPERLITLARRLYKNAFNPFSKAAKRAFELDGTSEKTQYVSDFTGIEPSTEKELAYISDSDRLSQTCELMGIEMDTLTDSDSHQILELLKALDAGYELASKRGFSMSAYDGDQAEAKKKRRLRLFKRIRQASDKLK